MSNRAALYIRPAVVADAHVVAKHVRAIAFESESVTLDVVETEAAARRVLVNPAFGIYFLATHGDECVGQLLVKPEWIPWRNAFEWKVSSVYVHPNHRRKGYLCALYHHVRRAAKEKGISALKLVVNESNATARTTFSQLGPHKSGRIFEMGIEG